MTFFSSFGILREQKHLKFLFNRPETRFERVELFLGHRLHVGIRISEHSLGFGDALLDLAVLAKLLDGWLHRAVLLRNGLELLLVLDQRGVGHLAAEVFVTGFELVEAVEHDVSPEGQGKRNRMRGVSEDGRS